MLSVWKEKNGFLVWSVHMVQPRCHKAGFVFRVFEIPSTAKEEIDSTLHITTAASQRSHVLVEIEEAHLVQLP